MVLWKWKFGIGISFRLSRFELEARGGEAVETAPEEAVDEHHDGGHDQCSGQQLVEAACVAGAANRAPTLPSKRFSPENENTPQRCWRSTRRRTRSPCR